jgi:transposase-like protein
MKPTDRCFQDETEARLFLEKMRWGGERVCPRCGTIGGEYETKRAGRYRCGAKECRKDFTVTTGTVMESSHILLTTWLRAFHLMASSKKGVSAHQLHRSLGVTYKTAWFLAHRIREAMTGSSGSGPLGGEGQVIEADETYFHKVETPRSTRKDGKPFRADNPKYTDQRGNYGPANKRSIVVLCERGGKARTFHVAEANRETVEKILHANASTDSRLHTDESPIYKRMGSRFKMHETTKHSAKEYARGDVNSNSAEGFFNVFKRGMTGVYQHCGERYLSRYLVEFEFRHNTRAKLGFTDGERAALAIKGIEGKRLTYRPPAHS